jgi:urease accessory protein
VAPGGWLEHLPDPWLPYAGSRMRADTRCVVDPDGILMVSESVMAGRLARGERFGLDRFESILRIERPDGSLVARDCLRIDHDEPPMAVGRFGDALVAGTLVVVAAGMDAESLRRAVDPVWGDGPAGGVQVGVSGLADAAGAWLRVLGPDAGSVMRIIGVARAAVRETLLGVAPRPDRRP